MKWKKALMCLVAGFIMAGDSAAYIINDQGNNVNFTGNITVHDWLFGKVNSSDVQNPPWLLSADSQPLWISLNGNTTSNSSINDGNVHVTGRLSSGTSQSRGIDSVSLGKNNSATNYSYAFGQNSRAGIANIGTCSGASTWNCEDYTSQSDCLAYNNHCSSCTWIGGVCFQVYQPEECASCSYPFGLENECLAHGCDFTKTGEVESGENNYVVGYNVGALGNNITVFGTGFYGTEDNTLVVGYGSEKVKIDVNGLSVNGILSQGGNTAIGASYNPPSVAVGGSGNTASASSPGGGDSVFGGFGNSATSPHGFSTIVGGIGNSIDNTNGLIAGGCSNILEDGSHTTSCGFMAGGSDNTMYGSYSSILAGTYNELGGDDAQLSTIIGGYQNKVFGSISSIISGNSNKINNTALESVIIGGHNSEISGRNSISIGTNNNISGSNTTTIGYGLSTNSNEMILMGFGMPMLVVNHSGVFANGSLINITGLEGNNSNQDSRLISLENKTFWVDLNGYITSNNTYNKGNVNVTGNLSVSDRLYVRNISGFGLAPTTGYTAIFDNAANWGIQISGNHPISGSGGTIRDAAFKSMTANAGVVMTPTGGSLATAGAAFNYQDFKNYVPGSYADNGQHLIVVGGQFSAREVGFGQPYPSLPVQYTLGLNHTLLGGYFGTDNFCYFGGCNNLSLVRVAGYFSHGSVIPSSGTSLYRLYGWITDYDSIIKQDKKLFFEGSMQDAEPVVIDGDTYQYYNSTQGAVQLLVNGVQKINVSSTETQINGNTTIDGRFMVTTLGGNAIRVNVTEAVTMGQILKVNTTAANMFSLASTDDDMPVCTVYDVSAAANTLTWCTTDGRGYLKVSATNNLGDVCYVSASVAGSADCSVTIPAITNHMREVGHAYAVNGTDGVTQTILHWN